MLLAVGVHLLGSLTEVLLSEVALVSEEDNGDGSVVSAPGDLGVNVRLPLSHCLEGGEAGQVEDDKGADGLLVVDAGHVAEALLPGNVPELEPHFCLGVPVDDLQGKVDPNLHNSKKIKSG